MPKPTDQELEAFMEYLIRSPKGKMSRHGDSVRGRCPTEHEDKNPSFSFKKDIDAWACSCGGGKGSELRERLGWTWKDTNQFSSAEPLRAPTSTTEYPLVTLEGMVVAYHIRRDYGKKDKRFSWRIPGNPKEGLHGLRKDELPLYRLPQLAETLPEVPVILTEGEKKADQLQALAGDLAIVLATVTGAPAKPTHPDKPWPIGCPNDAVLSALKGRKVYLWPDYDDPGREHMRQIAARLKVLNVKSQFIEWGGARRDGDDAGTFVEGGGTLEQLQELLKGKPIDWRSVFSTLPVKATELAPYIDMEIPYIAKPVLVEGSLTQIQGTPKGGKSSFSLYLSLCLATDTWPFPQHLRSYKPGPVDVLYFAWEDPKIMMAKRLSLYGAGLGFDRNFLPEHLTFIFAPDVFVERIDHVEALKATIAELKPKVVFIDTLSHVHASDENSASEMKIPMRHLDRIAREMNVAIVYLHHTGKGSADKNGQEKGRGSGAIAAAWHILVDWGVREKGSNVNPIEIQSKYENKWLNWNVAYEEIQDEYDVPQAIKWSIETMDDAGSGKEKTDFKRDRILTVLKKLVEDGIADKDGWSTAQQVTDVSNLGLDCKSIKRHLTTMCQEGSVQFKEGKATKSGREPNLYRASPGNLNL